MSQIPDAISVVIPTYNRAHLIKESIQSVLDQTLQPYEIIVVDDFSTDNTEEVVNSFNSPLIKFVKNERKKGANGARNTGIFLAKGEYIAFHDSDDIWLPEKLELQRKFIQKYNADLCFCSLKKEGGNLFSKKIIPSKQIKRNEISNKLKVNNLSSTQTIFTFTKLAKDILFDEDLKRLQDWDFMLRFIEKYEVVHLNNVLVVQKINGSSITNNESLILAYENIFKKHPYLITFGPYNKLMQKKIINKSKKSKAGLIQIFFLKFLCKLKSVLSYF